MSILQLKLWSLSSLDDYVGQDSDDSDDQSKNAQVENKYAYVGVLFLYLGLFFVDNFDLDCDELLDDLDLSFCVIILSRQGDLNPFDSSCLIRCSNRCGSRLRVTSRFNELLDERFFKNWLCFNNRFWDFGNDGLSDRGWLLDNGLWFRDLYDRLWFGGLYNRLWSRLRLGLDNNGLRLRDGVRFKDWSGCRLNVDDLRITISQEVSNEVRVLFIFFALTLALEAGNNVDDTGVVDDIHYWLVHEVFHLRHYIIKLLRHILE